MYQKPFFSLIVPCYNDGRYKAGDYLDRLLTSVVQSDLDYNDIEVILADDCSPKPYGRIVSKFKSHFNIKQVSTQTRAGYPGFTRNIGALAAQGEWICFADHDDMFYPRALRTVKDIIQTSKGAPIYVYADFDKVNSNDFNEVIETFSDSTKNNPELLVHGKFYNNDRLWKAYQLSFPDGLTSHEDLALGIQVKCALRKQDEHATLHIPTPIYMWINNPESISNTAYKDTKEHSFLERDYKCYLTATIGQYLDGHARNRISDQDLIFQVVPLLLNCWFQLNTFKINNKEGYIKENVEYVREMWNRSKELLNLSTPAFKVIMKQLSPAVVESINQTALKYNLPNFDEWVEELDRKEN